ncbi:hypothetical protein FHU13_004779 [Methylobacterium sp. R2-1]|nr:hypothetical protein [Methylobacterium sp. R2-1]
MSAHYIRRRKQIVRQTALAVEMPNLGWLPTLKSWEPGQQRTVGILLIC